MKAYRPVADIAALLLALTLAACGNPAPPPAATPSSSVASVEPSVSPVSPSESCVVPPSPSGASTAPSSTTVPPPASSAPPSPCPTLAPTRTVSPVPTVRPATPKPTATPHPAPPPPTAVACSIPTSLRGKDLERIPTTRKVVALTFDGGASAAGAASILATLRAKGVPATFFFTGEFASAYPSLARSIAADYPIGNHTQTHPMLTQLSDAQVRAEIRTGAATIRSVTSDDPRPYFRFPFGDVNSRVIGLVNSECYVPFRWTVDTLGWQGTSGGRSAASVTQRVLAGLTPGEIVLMHLGDNPTDHSTLDAAALPGIIDAVRARGYDFVTLEAVLGQSP